MLPNQQNSWQLTRYEGSQRWAGGNLDSWKNEVAININRGALVGLTLWIIVDMSFKCGVTPSKGDQQASGGRPRLQPGLLAVGSHPPRWPGSGGAVATWLMGGFCDSLLQHSPRQCPPCSRTVPAAHSRPCPGEPKAQDEV